MEVSRVATENVNGEGRRKASRGAHDPRPGACWGMMAIGTMTGQIQ